MVDFTKQQQRSPDYVTVHPLGHVPALRTDTYTMHESVANVMQLCDENPSAGLAPAIGSADRAAYYQWCAFACAELDPNLLDVMQHTMHLPECERVPAIARRGQDRLAKRGEVLSNALADREYLLGREFSGADIAIGYSCDWAADTGLIGRHPTLVDYYSRLQRRPAFRKVFPMRPATALSPA